MLTVSDFVDTDDEIFLLRSEIVLIVFIATIVDESLVLWKARRSPEHLILVQIIPTESPQDTTPRECRPTVTLSNNVGLAKLLVCTVFDQRGLESRRTLSKPTEWQRDKCGVIDQRTVWYQIDWHEHLEGDTPNHQLVQDVVNRRAPGASHDMRSGDSALDDENPWILPHSIRILHNEYV